MDPYDYDELYCDDGRYDDDPNPYHGTYSEEQGEGAVAQLVRVPACRAGGCGFESHQPRLCGGRSSGGRASDCDSDCHGFESHRLP